MSINDDRGILTRRDHFKDSCATPKTKSKRKGYTVSAKGIITPKKKARIRRGHAVPEIVQLFTLNDSIKQYMDKATDMINKIGEAPKFNTFEPPPPPSITPEERIEFNDLWAEQQVFQWLLESGRYDWADALAFAGIVVEQTREKRERANELQKKRGHYGTVMAMPARGGA